MKLQSKPTYYLSILSLGIILFLLGTISLISLHSHNISNYLKQQQNFIIDLKDGIPEADKYIIQAFLESKEEVNDASIRFVPKAEGLQLMKEEFNDEDLFLGIENPLQDVYEFRLQSGELDIEQIAVLDKEIKNLSGVLGFHYQKDPFQSMDQLKNQIKWFLIIFTALMLIFSLVLIFNTLRLMLENQRKRIFTMQMVGAEDRFILSPYLKIGTSIGWWASILALLLLLIVYFLIRQIFGIPAGIIEITMFGFVLFLLLLIGIVFSFLCSYFIVGKYLKNLNQEGPGNGN